MDNDEKLIQGLKDTIEMLRGQVDNQARKIDVANAEKALLREIIRDIVAARKA